MDRGWSDDIEARFAAYVEQLVGVIGHPDRARPLRDDGTGLVMPGERKSVEPLAALTAPARVSAQHQSLLHFVANAPWSDAAVLTKVREMVLPAIERSGPIEAWIIDDTGFAKTGQHSVGVARQYCGHLGKRDNCQVAVTLSLANHAASLPVAYRLSLPEIWTQDHQRRAKAGIPAEITFQTKAEIALDQIKAAVAAGLPRGVVLMDAAYGNDTDLRSAVSALTLSYVAAVLSTTSVWAPGTGPLPPKAWSGRGRRPTRLRRDEEHQPVSVKDLALSLGAEAWTLISWREGTNAPLSSRFARLRVRPAHEDVRRSAPRPEEWLLIAWPEGTDEPSHYWLSTLPDDIPFDRLVDLTMLRWRIERDYQELKQQLGLGHYEGRGWRGFHHHATLCLAAYGFLVRERSRFSPSRSQPSRLVQAPRLPASYRPRGAADPARAARGALDCDGAASPHGGARQKPRAMSLLRTAQPEPDTPASPRVTQ